MGEMKSEDDYYLSFQANCLITTMPMTQNESQKWTAVSEQTQAEF